MFGSTPFLYFFQLLNNWPRFMLFMWDSTVNSNLPTVPITFWTEPSSQLDSVLLNSVSTYENLYGRLHFSVCEHFNSSFSFRWEVSSRRSLERSFTSKNCSVTLNSLSKGEKTAYVSVFDDNGTTIAVGLKTFRTDSTWMAIIGDSFSSGEGNPEEPKNGTYPAVWLHETCHRSSHSFAALVFSSLKSSSDNPYHLSYLSCTGASVDKGILRSVDGKKSQLDVLEDISRARGDGPDLVIMTLGANDIGYSEILNSLVQGSSDENKNFDMRFFYLAHKLDEVAEKLKKMRAKRVILPLYYDITRNEKGHIDANCESFGQVKTSNLILAERQIFQRLNNLLSRKAHQHNWIVVNQIPSLFKNKGVCSKKSLILSMEDSLRIQGSYQGALHPNINAHSIIADIVLQKMKE